MKEEIKQRIEYLEMTKDRNKDIFRDHCVMCTEAKIEKLKDLLSLFE